MGIFSFKNIINDKVLIDHSLDIMAKWNRDKMELGLGKHRNNNFQKDWNQYGQDKFVFEILCELKKKEGDSVNYQKELQILEKMVIEEFNLTEKIYANK